MGQDSFVIDPSLPSLEGELSPAPRGPLLTALLAITGCLLVMELARLIGRHVLAFRRPAELKLTRAGIEVHGRTLILGKLLREHTSVIPRDGLVRITREVRYPSFAMYAGLVALALGSYLGVGLAVDGMRAASPSMLGTGLLIALLGLGIDFAFSSLVPGFKGRSRLVLVPRRGGILCLASVDPALADRLLAQLSGGERRASAKPPPAVEPAPRRADGAADEPEGNGAGDAH